jgi:hypothetical protein
MNPHEPDDADLESRLRASASPSLADDGFTTRVLASLPPSTPKTSWWRVHGRFIAVGAAAGLASTVAILPSFDKDLSGATDTLVSLLREPGAIVALAVIAIAWSLMAGDEAVE